MTQELRDNEVLTRLIGAAAEMAAVGTAYAQAATPAAYADAERVLARGGVASIVVLLVDPPVVSLRVMGHDDDGEPVHYRVAQFDAQPMAAQ